VTLQDFSTLATAISGFGVIFTLIILSIQTRHNTRALRASTFQQVVNSFAAISFDIAKEPSLSSLVLRATREFARFSEVERVQYSFMLLSFLRRAENVYVQSEIHTVHDLHWSGIQQSISAIMASDGARICWTEMKTRFSPKFRVFIDELLARQQSVPA
jgi:hypothetical protein